MELHYPGRNPTRRRIFAGMASGVSAVVPCSRPNAVVVVLYPMTLVMEKAKPNSTVPFSLVPVLHGTTCLKKPASSNIIVGSSLVPRYRDQAVRCLLTCWPSTRHWPIRHPVVRLDSSGMSAQSCIHVGRATTTNITQERNG